MLLWHTGMRVLSSASGTTLVEAVVAIGILAGAVTSLAGLSHMAIRSAMLARERSMAAIYSLQKMEALCRDVRSLAASPGDSLANDTPGFIEYLDPRGTVTASGSQSVRPALVCDSRGVRCESSGDPGRGRALPPPVRGRPLR